MNFSVIITQMAILFIVLAIGYAANKFRIMTTDTNKLLSKLVINIALPCTVLSSVISGHVTATGLNAAYFMLLSLGSYILPLIMSVPLPHLLRARKSDGGLYRFMICFGNVSFMGIPVIQSIFGDGAIFYASLFSVIFGVLCYSVGLLMITGRGKKLELKLFINPLMVVSLLTVLIFYIKLPVPAILTSTVDLVGKLTTPSAMLILGSTLACIPLKDVFTDIRVYLMAFVKLIIIPVMTWLVLHVFITDQLMLGILVTLSAMPSATNTTMLSMEYGGNEQLASKGVFMTTLFSIITIPLLLYFLL